MGCIRSRRRRRTRCLAGCFALALAGASAAPLSADPAAPMPPEPAAPAAPAPRSLAADLERAAEALAAAEARSAAADAAYARMRRRNWPRGAARDAIVRERIDARQALAQARAHYAALARRVDTSL